MKKRFTNIIPECYADTLLVELLGFSFPNHALNSCISQVLKVVKQSRPHEKVVGIIDSDRGKSEKLLDSFSLSDEKHGIKKYTRGNHTVLVIAPAFEGWVFINVQEKDIDPVDHGFDNREYFKRICKSAKAKQNDHLKKFLNRIKQKNALGFLQLKSWICEGIGINEDDIQ